MSNSHSGSMCLESHSVSHFSKNEVFTEIEEIGQISLRKGWVFEDTTCQLKRHGYIEAFVVSTHKGLFRNTNEDRVSIVLNGT